MASAGTGWFFGGSSSAVSQASTSTGSESGTAASHDPDAKASGEKAGDEPQRGEGVVLHEEVAKLRTALSEKETKMSNLEATLRKREEVRSLNDQSARRYLPVSMAGP